MIDFITLGGAVVAIMAVSLCGVLFVGRHTEEWLGARLSYLVAFSAGVFLITGGALTLEVFHLFEDALHIGVVAIVIGYMGGWLVEYVLPESHHHHDPHDHEHQHSRTSARKIIVGDTIHNIGDGIMLVPAFLVSPALGLAVTVSILIHEALQELSEFFVLKQAGYTTRQAIGINVAVSSAIIIGVGLSYFAIATHALEGVLLALSAGFFFHVVIHDLLPKRHQHETTTQFMRHIAWLVVGLVLMAVVAEYFGDAHEHGGEENHTEEIHLEGELHAES